MQLECESTLTTRYQTTIPETVRRALNLSKQDKIRYTLNAEGQVILSRSTSIAEDPVLTGFLSFLEQDLVQHPEALQPADAQWVTAMRTLVAPVEFDLNAALDEQDE